MSGGQGGGLDPAAVVDAFRTAGLGPYFGVPCSFLGPMISVLQADHPEEYLAAANEGEAVAVASGAHLAGRRPVVIMQNSGLGNAVNPLTSLCHTLRIPVLLLVTWRGEPGHPDEPQHRLMGALTRDLLTAMGVRHEIFPSDPAELAPALERARRHMDEEGLPFAFVVPKGALRPFRPGAAAPAPAAGLMLRAEAIAHIVAEAGPDALLVATTGKTARELENDWDRSGNLYVVGSMGCASSIGLGVALGAPRRKVVVLDGDGAALMRLEAMATIGHRAPGNLVHVVLDNEAYESTGGQPTASAGIDFGAIAAACGYRSRSDVRGAEPLRRAVARIDSQPGPHFVRVRIRPGSDPALGRPSLTPPEARARFMAEVGAA
uniref:Phosphonopyruvate decarboxylase n=1 Tax=Kitasatospora sp. NRRL F-6133 TaxID=1415539 RepID=U5YRK2_9ACTN|nr:phosphonopyruvate decarboxylase [Kitasatospora sp. NRRL F-6133]